MQSKEQVLASIARAPYRIRYMLVFECPDSKEMLMASPKESPEACLKQYEHLDVKEGLTFLGISTMIMSDPKGVDQYVS